MTRYVALLRAVNVGGAKVVMSELRDLVEGLGHCEVATYINSGNVVLTADEGAADTVRDGIETALERHLGKPVPVVVRTHDQLASALAANPFPGAEPSRLLLGFLTGEPSPGAADRLAALDLAPERAVLGDGVVYLDLPNGVGRSRMATVPMDKLLGVASTARNLRTVAKLVDLTA